MTEPMPSPGPERTFSPEEVAETLGTSAWWVREQATRAGPHTCASGRVASGSLQRRSRISSTARPSSRTPPARSASPSRSMRRCSVRPCAPSALTAPVAPPPRRPGRPPDGPKARPRWGRDRPRGRKVSTRVRTFAQVSDPRRSAARRRLTIWTISNPTRGTIVTCGNTPACRKGARNDASGRTSAPTINLSNARWARNRRTRIGIPLEDHDRSMTRDPGRHRPPG